MCTVSTPPWSSNRRASSSGGRLPSTVCPFRYRSWPMPVSGRLISNRPTPARRETFSRDLPQYVEDARNGKGPIGDLVKRYDLEQKVQDNQPKIQEAVTNFGKNGLDIVQRVFTTIVAGLTVMVLTVLILVEGPSLSSGVLNL